MSALKNYRLELTDYEQVALEIRDKEIKRKEKEEIAKNFKVLGIEIEKISHATGLTIEDIEKL